ncbi:MAG: TetR/AcrR family transcriptional regulator [Solirubrobacteraceae bacterium]|nr:TetR/AcrR family transcriptional regulator [Solirubrobacteraceae bacterium]
MPAPQPPTAHEIATPAAHDEMGERILDAAYDELNEYGVSRASIDSVADRLGIGRMTVYRRFNSKETLARAVFRREAQRYLSRIHTEVGKSSVRAGVERGFIVGVLQNKHQQLMDRLLEREPVAALPYFIGEAAGELLEHAIAITYAAIATARDAEEYDARSLRLVATTMIRLAHSYSVAPPPGGIDESMLRRMARRSLLPLLDPTK